MSFDKPLIAIVLSLLLSGCQLSPPLDNKFLSVTPKPEPALTGIWSGTMGPYMISLIFKNDGSGYACSAWKGKNTISRLKYDGKYIQYQEGTHMQVDRIDKTSLTISIPYTMTTAYNLRKDNELNLADPFCVVELPKFK